MFAIFGLANRPPTRMEAFRIAEIGTRPPSFKLASPCIPAEATQQHSSQTGFSPSWQGVTWVFKSAERHVVSRANAHPAGERGG